MEHLRAGGEDVTSLMPGEVFVSKFQMTISLPPASSQAWKKAIRSVVDVIDTILHINSSVKADIHDGGNRKSKINIFSDILVS